MATRTGSEELRSAFSPMRQFICKVASRCNLDCDYCYVYHHADQTWRDQPKLMAPETIAQVARRVNEHAKQHSLRIVDVVLHGGEPLIAGTAYLDFWCETIRANTPDTDVSFGMQTNGTLFDERALEWCAKWHISVGLSMDGPQKANDLHRFDFQKRSSFPALENALSILTSPAGRDIWAGFLTVIDLRSDPSEVYSYLKSFQPRSIEFLLPLGHYDLRPPGKSDLDATPYADWLMTVFDAWYREAPQTIKIQRFHDIITLLGGGTHSSEEWGMGPVDFAIIETDGTIQGVDTLKTTFAGANNLNLNVFDNSFNDMFWAPHVIARQLPLDHLCKTCRECPLVTVCGGGYYPHRYSTQNGFQNPSVYCADIKKLILGAHGAVSNTLAVLQSHSEEKRPTPALQ